jgi:hypothetical protein
MFQEILVLLPQKGGWEAAVALTVGALVGLFCWIAGSRYNHKIMALVGVAAGGILGILAPRCMGWDVNTMATALSFALVAGVLGFAMPRIGVAIGMAALLAAWGALLVWIFYHGSAKLELPTGTASFSEFCRTLWKDLPDGVQKLLPLSAAIGAGVGLVLTIFLPRIATALFYSTLGVSILLVAGLWGVRCSGADWPRFVPVRTQMQAVLVAGLVALGVVLQTAVMPIKRKVAARDDAGDNDAQPSHAI